MFNSPLAVDQYSRFMVEMFNERSIIGVSTVFQSLFGRPETGAKTVYSPDSKVVEIDIMRGNERLAALIQRGGNGRPITGQQNTNLEKYTTFSRVYPLVEEEGDINADQLLSRVAGENPYEGRSRLDRNRFLAREHHLEHIRRSVRLFEYLAGQSIITGKQPAFLGTTNTDLIYDFRRSSSNFITPSTNWDVDPYGGTSPGTLPTILPDIDGACDQMRKQGHMVPDYMIMGGLTATAFIKDKGVQSVANKLITQLITIGGVEGIPAKLQFLIDAGAVCLGRLNTPAGYELWMFTYKDGYNASTVAGTWTKYMPEDYAIIGASSARYDRYFGPPERLPMTSQKAAWYQEMFGFSMMAPPMPPNIKAEERVVTPAMFYSDAYEASNGKTITIRTQSAPIFATTMTDTIVILKELVTVP